MRWVLVAMLLISAPASAQFPPINIINFWATSGGAVGETLSLSLQHAPTGQYAVGASPSLVRGRLGLGAPISLVAMGRFGTNGRAVANVAIPAHRSLVGTVVYLQAYGSAGGGAYSTIETVMIAPASAPQFQQTPNILRYGGADVGLPNGQFLFTGGEPNLSPVDTVSLFDPTTQIERNVGKMLVPRSLHRATLLPTGKVLILGGLNASTTVELYDPTVHRSQFVTTLPNILPRHGVTVRDPMSRRDFVFFENAARARDRHFLYDVQKSTFTTVTRNVADSQYVALPGTGALLCTGGVDSNRSVTDRVDLFLPRTQTFYPLGKLRVPRMNHAAIALSWRYVLIVGGNTSGSNAPARGDLEVFDVVTRNAFLLPFRLVHPRRSPTLVARKSGEVLVCGGWASTRAALDRTVELIRATSSIPLRVLPGPSTFVVYTPGAGGSMLGRSWTKLHYLK